MATIVNGQRRSKTYSQGELLLRSICANGKTTVSKSSTNSVQGANGDTRTFGQMSQNGYAFPILPSLRCDNISSVNLTYNIKLDVQWQSGVSPINPTTGNPSATLTCYMLNFFGNGRLINQNAHYMWTAYNNNKHGELTLTDTIDISGVSNTQITLTYTNSAVSGDGSTYGGYMTWTEGINFELTINSITLSDGTVLTQANASNL